MYVVASRNDKDFSNLMDIFLDSVFYPRLYEAPEIFMQEGWHYELQKENGKITYNGVVYNEMKGTFSSLIAILKQEIKKSLYPDTHYRYTSGGYPASIPNLTIDDFKDFHTSLYHPSNSYIYIYGSGDIEKYLRV